MIERRPIKANGSGEPATLAQVQAEIEAALAAGELSLQEKFEWFERKLKAALTDSSATASELGKLLGQTDNAIAAAEQEALAARERALDPVQSPDLQVAREAMENSALYLGRVRTQQPRLLQRYQETLLKEQVQTYLTRLRELAPERDALAQELRDTYQQATSKLLDLFSRVRAFEQRARQELGNPPANCAVLEHIDTRCWTKCVLPDLQHPDRNVWPPLNSFASDFASTMVVAQGPGAAWSSDFYRERRNAEIAAEQEKLALHAQARAKEQLARENEELKAQFQARQQNGRT